MRRRLTRCALAGAAIILLGCGGADRLDARALERGLPSQLVADHPEVVTDVVCPERIAKQQGASVQCSATLGGTPVVVNVTQIDASGAVKVELDRPIFDVPASVAVLAARLSKELSLATTIACAGPAVRVLTVGEVLRCTASDPSQRTRSLDVTVLDDTGTLGVALSS